jgi:hypothetical protein
VKSPKNLQLKTKCPVPKGTIDDMVEVIGWMQDPTCDMRDFQGREMLFPKRWVTIGVVSAETKVNV